MISSFCICIEKLAFILVDSKHDKIDKIMGIEIMRAYLRSQQRPFASYCCFTQVPNIYLTGLWLITKACMDSTLSHGLDSIVENIK